MDMISCFGYLSVLGISKLIHVFKYKTVHMIHSQISIRGRFAKATAKESKSKSKQQIHSNSNTTNATSTTAIIISATALPTWSRGSSFSQTLLTIGPKLNWPSAITIINKPPSRRVLLYAIDKIKIEASSIYASFCLLRQIWMRGEHPGEYCNIVFQWYSSIQITIAVMIWSLLLLFLSLFHLCCYILSTSHIQKWGDCCWHFQHDNHREERGGGGKIGRYQGIRKWNQWVRQQTINNNTQSTINNAGKEKR